MNKNKIRIRKIWLVFAVYVILIGYMGLYIATWQSRQNNLLKISEQLALKNRRRKRIWKVIGFILLAVIVINMLLVVLGTVTYNEKNADITTIEEKF